MFRLKQKIHFEYVSLENLPTVIAEHVRRVDELVNLTSVTWMDHSHHKMSSIDIQVPFAKLIVSRLKMIRFRCRSAKCTELARVLICGFNSSIVEEIILSGMGSVKCLAHRIKTSENIKLPQLKVLELDSNAQEHEDLLALLRQLLACECKSLRSITVTLSNRKGEIVTSSAIAIKETLRLLGQLCHIFPWIESICLNSWAKRRGVWISDLFRQLAGVLTEGFWNRIEMTLSVAGVPPEKLYFGETSLLTCPWRASYVGGDPTAVQAAWQFCVVKPNLPVNQQAEALMSFLTLDITSHDWYRALKSWEVTWAIQQFNKIVESARLSYGANAIAPPIYARTAFVLTASIHGSERSADEGLSEANLHRLVFDWMVGNPTSAMQALVSGLAVNSNAHLNICPILRDLISNGTFASFCKQTNLVDAICREFCRRSSLLPKIVKRCPSLIQALVQHSDFKPCMLTENNVFPRLILLLPSLLPSLTVIDPITSKTQFVT